MASERNPEVIVLAAESVTPKQYAALLAHTCRIAGTIGPFAVRVSPYVQPGEVLAMNLGWKESPDA